MKIGFIGLGIMGRPMAKNLIKAGHELVVCDFNKDHVADLVSCGAKSAANGAEMAKEVDVIITMVQNSPQVRAAVLGENGVAETAKPGFTLIDMSSIDPVESKKIGEELEDHEGVSEVVYVSADEAWEEFQKQYFEGNPELAEGFKNDNPLASSDNYEVYMKTMDDNQSLLARSRSLSATQKELVEFAQKLDGVREVNRSDVVANTLSSVNTLVAVVSIAIIIILFGVSIFLISNTVTMGITVRKEEIAIMKYIGAKDFVVRSPFVIEGLIIGIFGAAIPLVLLYFLYDKAVEYIMEKFSILQNIINFLPVGTVYQILLPIGLVMGIGIGFLGSFFTVRKHLKV